MMRKRFMLMLLSLVCAGAMPATLSHAAGEAGQGKQAPANTLTEAEKAQGWQLLFNGKDLTGWRGLGMDALPSGIEVADGTIYKNPAKRGNGDLMTEKTYENFELTFEWKIAKGCNNGIKYNVSEEMSAGPQKRNHSALGFEYQVLDDPNHADGKNPTHQCGALYELFAADNAKKKVKPIGEWNTAKIVFDGNHIEHWLNGEKIVSADLGTPAMDKALAASKWSKNKEFGVKRAGHIVVTDHTDAAWFRNLKIRELPKK